MTLISSQSLKLQLFRDRRKMQSPLWAECAKFDFGNTRENSGKYKRANVESPFLRTHGEESGFRVSWAMKTADSRARRLTAGFPKAKMFCPVQNQISRLCQDLSPFSPANGPTSHSPNSCRSSKKWATTASNSPAGATTLKWIARSPNPIISRRIGRCSPSTASVASPSPRTSSARPCAI